MQTLTLSIWRLRLVTFAIAALAAASALYWALKWQNTPAPVRGTLIVPQMPAIDSAKVALLLGARPKTPADGLPATSTSSSYKLLGVIAQGGKGTQGSALIAVEGAPAKPYRVGDVVANNLRLQSVKARSITLGSESGDAASVTLELPPLPGTR